MARGARALATTTPPDGHPGATGAVLAHLAAGAVAGIAAGLVGWLLLTPVRLLLPWGAALAVVGAVASAAALRDLGRLREGRTDQVPQHWLPRYGPAGAYSRYGLVLGATFGSHVPFSAAWVLLVVVGLQPSPWLAGATIGLLGGVRAAAPLVSYRSRRLTAALAAGLERKGALRRVSAATSVVLLPAFVLVTWPA
jgi:hypothetical protein